LTFSRERITERTLGSDRQQTVEIDRLGRPSVAISSGTICCFLSSFFMSLSAAAVSRFAGTSMSRTSPSESPARQRSMRWPRIFMIGGEMHYLWRG